MQDRGEHERNGTHTSSERDDIDADSSAIMPSSKWYPPTPNRVHAIRPGMSPDRLSTEFWSPTIMGSMRRLVSIIRRPSTELASQVTAATTVVGRARDRGGIRRGGRDRSSVKVGEGVGDGGRHGVGEEGLGEASRSTSVDKWCEGLSAFVVVQTSLPHLHPHRRLLVPRHVQHIVQVERLGAQGIVLQRETLDELEQLCHLRVLRPCIDTQSDREPLLHLRQSLVALLRAQDLVLAHLLQVRNGLAESILELDGPFKLLLDAMLARRSLLLFRDELLARVLEACRHRFELRRGRDEACRVDGEARDGLAVFFERDEQGAITRVCLLEVAHCMFEFLFTRYAGGSSAREGVRRVKRGRAYPLELRRLLDLPRKPIEQLLVCALDYPQPLLQRRLLIQQRRSNRCGEVEIRLEVVQQARRVRPRAPHVAPCEPTILGHPVGRAALDGVEDGGVLVRSWERRGRGSGQIHRVWRVRCGSRATQYHPGCSRGSGEGWRRGGEEMKWAKG